MKIESTSLLVASHVNVADVSGATKNNEGVEASEQRSDVQGAAVVADAFQQQPAYSVRISEAAQAAQMAEATKEVNLVQAEIPKDVQSKLEKLKAMIEAMANNDFRVLTPSEFESDPAQQANSMA